MVSTIGAAFEEVQSGNAGWPSRRSSERVVGAGGPWTNAYEQPGPASTEAIKIANLGLAPC
jgi:hypothetical protein